MKSWIAGRVHERYDPHAHPLPPARPVSWRVAVGLVVSVATGCQPDGGTTSASSGKAPPAEECNWLTAPEPTDADEPFCDLEFREVTRLEDVDSITPHPAVMVLHDGRYVTATYSPGKVALWSPDGVLVDVIGKGAGEGPGEFGGAMGLTQVTEDELLVLTGMPIVHRYTTGGRFVRSFRLPTPGGAGSAVTYGGIAITTAYRGGVRQGFLLTDDSVRAFALRGRRGSSLLVAAAEDVGIWSAERDRYVLRRHAFPSGSVVDSLVVARDWFPGPRGNEGELFGLHADGRGLIWTVATAADPDAPSDNWMPTGEEEPIEDWEEHRAKAVEFSDYLVEAFTPGGRLVVSARFDSYREVAEPMHGNFWYRQTEDRLAIVVLEAVLTERH